MSFLRKLISTPQGAKLLAEDTGISHMLLKCFAKARDMKKSSELFETVREALLTTVRMRTHLSLYSSTSWALCRTTACGAGLWRLHSGAANLTSPSVCGGTCRQRASNSKIPCSAR